MLKIDGSRAESDKVELEKSINAALLAEHSFLSRCEKTKRIIVLACVKVRLFQICVCERLLVVVKTCKCMSRCVFAWGWAHECWCQCLCTSATCSVVLCMIMSVCMCFCVHGGDDHSKSACFSWVGATAVSVCLGPGLFADKRMLRDK